MEGQEVPQPKESNTPKVVISESINSPECPYDVSIDVAGTVELIRLAGVKEEDIEGLTIKIDRKPSKSRIIKLLDRLAFGRSLAPAGEYSPHTRTMSIYADSYYEDWGRHSLIESAEQILQDPDRAGWLKTDLTSRRRLSKYLRVAPAERARQTVQRLADIYVSRQLDSTLSHEAKHAGDDSRGELYGGPLELIRDGAMFFFYIVTDQKNKIHRNRPLEKRAYEFANEQGKRFGLISLRTKPQSRGAGLPAKA
ncbi:MAG: hypothetical protein HYW63_00065 [Candidatus Levybacteria bacterium]|nr:hypothetical protein [Candidatus Levybacteria bacterium]